MQSEVTVILKGEDSTFKKKFLCYDSFALEKNDPIINGFIRQASEEYKAIPEEIWLKISILIGEKVFEKAEQAQ